MVSKGVRSILPVIILGFTCVPLLGQSPRPAIIDPVRPPGTLEQMWKAAELIAVVQVDKSGQPEARQIGGQTIVNRVHDVTMIEAIKLTGPSGRFLKIAQLGGSADLAGRAIQTNRPVARVMRPGDRAVLVLAQTPDKGIFEVMFGNAGAFWIDPSGLQVEIPPGAASYKEFSGRKSVPLSEFIKILQSFK